MRKLMIGAAFGCALMSTFVFALAFTPALAPTGVPSGTIYFQTGGPGTIYRMAADGKSKTPLGISFSCRPSRILRGGHRWFTQVRNVPGEIRADGLIQRDLFALRDDGLTVRLTNDPMMDAGDMKFAPGESADFALVGGVLRAFNADGTWNFSRFGYYTATLAFDANGIPSLSEPLAFSFPVGIYYDANGAGPFTDTGDFDWSPDGTKAVGANSAHTELRIYDLSTGAYTALATGTAYSARWSPDGSRIAFVILHDGTGRNGKLVTISPTGAGRTTIVTETSGAVYNTFWSPDSGYLIYQYRVYGGVNDIMRVSSTGSGKTNLTKDFAGEAYPLGWR